MCLFLKWNFEYQLCCPLDQETRTVRIQAHPQPHDHFLDVVACSAASDVQKLVCRKQCRDAVENGEYWQDSEVGYVA